MFFLRLLLILAITDVRASENGALVMDPYDLAAVREHQPDKIPRPNAKESRAWLGSVVLRILKLSHYKSYSIPDVEREIIDNK